MKTLAIVLVSMISVTAFAHGHEDGSDLPACANVTPKCMSASVTGTNRKGKTITGYQPGMHKADGKGLWVDCVDKLATGAQVEGVTGVSQTDAQACKTAFKAAHGGKKM